MSPRAWTQEWSFRGNSHNIRIKFWTKCKRTLLRHKLPAYNLAWTLTRATSNVQCALVMCDLEHCRPQWNTRAIYLQRYSIFMCYTSGGLLMKSITIKYCIHIYLLAAYPGLTQHRIPIIQYLFAIKALSNSTFNNKINCQVKWEQCSKRTEYKFWNISSADFLIFQNYGTNDSGYRHCESI